MHELLETVQNNDSSCIDRGEAIDQLIQFGMKQVEIARKTNLSTSAISHLKKCFDNLVGKARAMCKAKRMNRDACYLLARASNHDQERILRRAVELCKIRETRRSVHPTGPKGRQTLPGQITDNDIKEAMKDLKSRLAGS